MKAAIAAVTITRYRRGTAGTCDTQTLRTWTAAENLVREWLIAPITLPRDENTVLLRPRWTNGLALNTMGVGPWYVHQPEDLGIAVVKAEIAHYATKKGLRSVKAGMAREVLARCAFTDAEAEEVGDDARTFDVASRALHAMYPDEATIHVDRIRAWMLDGGRIR